MANRRNLRLIYGGAFLRSASIGLMGVVLGIYLARRNFSATKIGLVLGVGLAGAALGTLLVSLRADRFGRRRMLVLLSILAAFGGLGLTLTNSFSGILLAAFFGTLNGMGTDRAGAYSLEQAIIPQTVSSEGRTTALSWYNLVLDAGHALGALASSLPLLLERWFGISLFSAYAITFAVYAACNLLSAVVYASLSPEIEALRTTTLPADASHKISAKSRRIIGRFSAISGLDSLGGGLLTDALFAYWFFLRFGVSEAALGPLFSAAHLLNSASYLLAARLSRRIGLLNTMVFTHIPSSLFLMAVPFAPSFPLAIVLFLARESLVEMDVPTRQSYLAAVVEPQDRTFASGVSNLTRNVSWATVPVFAGYLMQHLAAASPLFLGAAAKITYDLLLYATFRGVKPPEEDAPKREAVSTAF